MSDRAFGADTLTVPAYVTKNDGPEDPGLAAWKQEHPNWLVAGRWTPAPRPTRIMPPTPGQGRAASRSAPEAGLPSLDPAPLPVANFQRMTDESRVSLAPKPAPSGFAYSNDLKPKMVPDIRSTLGNAFRQKSDLPTPDETQ